MRSDKKAEAPIAEASKQPSPFWRFSLRIYPSVAEACLELQDRFGVDVNVLLFLLWAAHRGRKAGADDVRRIVSTVERWSGSVVVPLRSVRRFLRSPPAIVDPETAERFRGQVKRIELEAERLQQEGLYLSVPLDGLGVPEPSREAAAVANIEAYALQLGTAFPQPFIEALLAGLRRLEQEGDA